jgi:two-component system sensor histidine kinase KdpD
MSGLRYDTRESTPTPSLRQRGKLRVFLGMAPGAGKTYAMLQSAQREKLAGREVVIACVNTHGARTTDLLTKGLRLISAKRAPDGASTTSELDLDAVLAWHPHVAVVDELAYTNPAGFRHAKRYQDVLELLESGIDVYTTLNIQDVASRADAVRQIAGIPTEEVVPDSFLELAELEIVDLSPERFEKRLHEGMAYLTQNPELARVGFFRESNLMALRDLAWRFVYEQISRSTRHYMEAQQIQGRLKSGHRLLAVVSPDDGGEESLRWSRNLAESLNCSWIALYVEAQASLQSPDSMKVARLLALAGELGAEVITTADIDPVRGILRVTAQQNATQIIVAKPISSGWGSLHDGFVRRLVNASKEADVHIVCTQRTPETPSLRYPRLHYRSSWKQYLAAIGTVIAVTLLASLLEPLIGGPHAAALVFLLAIVILGSFAGRGPTLLAAAMSAVLWDYILLPPKFAFRTTDFQDTLLLGMYFIVAILMGQLTTRIRAQQDAEALREERATALYLLTQELAKATTVDQIVEKAVNEMGRVFKSRICVLLSDTAGKLHTSEHPASAFGPTEEGRRTAMWVLGHGDRAGQFTGRQGPADAMYIPLGTPGSTSVGVLGLQFSQSEPPTIHQLNLLDACSQQIALALERHRLRTISEKAGLLAESERLSKTLLDSMSHEMRTPLAVIKSATGNLVEFGETDPTTQSMIGEILEATERLNHLVGNVLDITRLESGHVKPRLNECDVNDLVQVSLRETERELKSHQIALEISPDLPMIKMDFVLMQQALMNLLSNAARHTPRGTLVQVMVRVENDFLVLEVADRGPGIQPESMDRIFDKFYRCPNAPTGGTGLGLSLVKGFVEAQGGRVKAKSRQGGGTIFTILLPAHAELAVAEEVDT